jgi:formylglycine-generating enzyme required for sulfatase activity
MQPSAPLLTAIGQAMLDALDSGVLGDVTVQADAGMAGNVWSLWSGRVSEAGRREEVEALIRAPAEDVQRAVTAVATSVAGQQSTERRGALMDYLRHVPGTIRRFLRRPSDPSGRTLPPSWAPTQGQELLAYLPPRMPWFAIGDQPRGIGDWELEEVLEVGNWGEAWKARQPRRPEIPPAELHFFLQPALKEPIRRQGPAVLDRVRELSSQPGWLPLKHIALDADSPCLEYAHVEAGDLCAVVREWNEAPRTPGDQATVLLRQIAQIMATAHRLQPPLVHGALHPGDIRVARAADGAWQCTITNLGLADVLQRSGAIEGRGSVMLQLPAMRGYRPFDRLAYASPQQLRGEPLRPRDDVYALGVLWYQLLTADVAVGRPGGSQWRRRLLDRGVAPSLLELLETCFEDEPRYRPEDAGALAAQLESLVNAVVVTPARKPDVNLASLLPGTPDPPVSATPATPALPRQRTRRAEVRQLFETLQQETKEQAKLLTNAAGMKLVLIQPGTFLMGSPETEVGRRQNEGPQHEVQLPNAFYMSVHLVTQANFLQVMNQNPARCTTGRGGGPEHPVENVTWEQAVAFCRRLSEMPEEKAARRVYRLPTEAEWEYACRAGTATVFSFGDALSADQANFDGAFPYGGAPRGLYVEKTTPVGSYPANNFGLYDMHGNVWQWCADWHDSDTYARSTKRNPKGPTEGQFRIIRGGSWRSHATSCRSAYRNGLSPKSRDGLTGFRVVVDVA